MGPEILPLPSGMRSGLNKESKRKTGHRENFTEILFPLVYSLDMAPPTGIKIYRIQMWRQGGLQYACLHDDYRQNIVIQGGSEQAAFDKAQSVALENARQWLEVQEPYYVETLLSDYSRFEKVLLHEPCPRCRSYISAIPSERSLH